jgi:hypothetical protein
MSRCDFSRDLIMSSAGPWKPDGIAIAPQKSYRRLSPSCLSKTGLPETSPFNDGFGGRRVLLFYLCRKNRT